MATLPEKKSYSPSGGVRRVTSKRALFAQRKPGLHQLYPHSKKSIVIDGKVLESFPSLKGAFVGRSHLEELRICNSPLTMIVPIVCLHCCCLY